MMNGWKQVKLGEFVLFKNGKKRPKSTGKIPVYGGNGVLDYTSEKNKENVVIVGRVGAYCGSVYYNSSSIWVSDNAISAETKGDSDIKYIYYLMISLQLNKRHIGTSQPLLTQEILNNIEVNFPSLETQKQIAKILSSIDDKIELNNKINDNLEQQAQAIFKSWFVDFDPFGGVMPSDWEVLPISDVTKVVTKGTTPTTLGKQFQNQGISFIKAESILDNHSFDKSKFAYIDEETNTLLKRSIIHGKDIVFTIAGTLGRFALVSEDILPCNTNQAVAIIRTETSIISAEYLYSFFLGNWHNDYYSKRIQQAVQANLSLATIKSLPITIANNQDKQRYENLIIPILKNITINQQQNQKLAQLRDTLLPKLMSGEIDVSQVEFKEEI